ncbi:hypothetical protein [Pseudoflavonifractor sp. An85]|uniref:hypothetical protein n=1 Tax=Pseudoflavonifractor sp. An85 TaxID=1965661 RepID=UPI00117A51EB|nr:hypothetical protein [Pseudoflavonifractor sp. An85]
MKTIFFGDMCGEENTSQPASVEFVLPRWTNYARGGLQPTQKDACIFLKEFPVINVHIPSHPKG